MTFSLEGHRTLVTGASRGIGKGIALAFADAGADVAISARDEAKLNDVAEQIRAKGRNAVVVAADVMDEDAMRAAVDSAADQLGGLSVLVNNAGGNSFSVPLANMRMSGWEKTFTLNVTSVVHTTQAAAPHLLASGNGSVINLSSVASVGGAPLMSHYGAAKAAISSLTKSLAVEWAHANVRVNALLPGWIETDLTDFLRASDETEAGVLSRVPMGRWGRVEEIAEPAVFLASDAASFLTGQTLVVDGGITIMP